jgi:hypothetical protein
MKKKKNKVIAQKPTQHIPSAHTHTHTRIHPQKKKRTESDGNAAKTGNGGKHNSSSAGLVVPFAPSPHTTRNLIRTT